MGISKDKLFAVRQQSVDLLHGIADGRDGHVVVDGCNEVSGVLGAVHIEIPVAVQQFGLPIGQVGAQNSGQL